MPLRCRRAGLGRVRLRRPSLGDVVLHLMRRGVRRVCLWFGGRLCRIYVLSPLEGMLSLQWVFVLFVRVNSLSTVIRVLVPIGVNYELG